MSFQIAAGASATQVKKRCSRHDTEDRGLPHTLVLRANKVIDIRHAWCGAESGIVQVFGRRQQGGSARSTDRRPKSAKARSRGKFGTG
jgi:hypothetical protein